MKPVFRFLLIGVVVVALLAAACATATQVTPISAPAETNAPPADNVAVASAAKPRFIDSYATW